MDKLLSSFFCCSVDTKDDTDDRYHRQSSRKSNVTDTNSNSGKSPSPRRSKNSLGTTAKNTTSTKPTLATENGKHQVDILKEEHSVNDTDTMANTNESNPNTPIGTNKTVADVGNKTDESDDINVEGQTDDLSSFMDLTKMQEGQKYDEESGWLLGIQPKEFKGKKCLILDLDETLVHSSFKYLRTADFVIPVEIDNQIQHVYVIKRPGVDEFLKKVGQWFEVVVFTASVLKYGNPLLDKLDIHKSVHHRLFRDSCYIYQGNFIKNLSQIGRPLSESIIIDNSPASYIFHPQHSIPISSWFSDTHDNELIDLLPFLEDISKPNVDDVGLVLDITQ
ncbi:hypothetical protein QFC19_005897 [Naganishia cerealis]|uniref:Uncharacterized protein n=1 Tax=Naganishia cerealis TaxID=610337 RepID=A0ACC2VKI1_9TREE|nr:hypothetical protein QFC19_005897 [Naganishia cerealis]